MNYKERTKKWLFKRIRLNDETAKELGTKLTDATIIGVSIKDGQSSDIFLAMFDEDDWSPKSQLTTWNDDEFKNYQGQYNVTKEESQEQRFYLLDPSLVSFIGE